MWQQFSTCVQAFHTLNTNSAAINVSTCWWVFYLFCGFFFFIATQTKSSWRRCTVPTCGLCYWAACRITHSGAHATCTYWLSPWFGSTPSWRASSPLMTTRTTCSRRATWRPGCWLSCDMTSPLVDRTEPTTVLKVRVSLTFFSSLPLSLLIMKDIKTVCCLQNLRKLMYKMCSFTAVAIESGSSNALCVNFWPFISILVILM